MLERLDNPQFPSIQEACQLVPAFQAVAISPMFAITLSPLSDSRYLLTSHHGFIGEVNSATIYIKHPPVAQEVRDFIRRTNQHMEIVDA